MNLDLTFDILQNLYSATSITHEHVLEQTDVKDQDLLQTTFLILNIMI